MTFSQEISEKIEETAEEVSVTNGTENNTASNQEIDKVNAALSLIKAELEEAGSLEKGDLKEQLELLENLLGKIQRGVKIKLTDNINRLFKNERERLEKIVSQIHQANDVDSLFKQLCATLRESLQVARVLIYRFNDDTTGKVLAESLVAGWTPTWGETLPALCFGAKSSQEYAQQQIVTIKDVGLNGLTPYQTQLLEKFQVQASIAVPIILEDQVWGLIVLHQCTAPHPWKEAEINLIQQVSKELTVCLQPQELREQLKQQWERELSIASCIQEIQQQSSDLQGIFNTTTQQVRQLLKSDRVVVYRFNPDWSGEVVAESAGTDWVSVLEIQKTDDVLYSAEMTTGNVCDLNKLRPGTTFRVDTYLQETRGGRYTRGENVRVVNDIYAAGFSPCYLESLEKYQAKAYIIAPIFQDEKLWGLLAVYQNSAPRKWTETEVSMILQLTGPLGMAIQQAEYIEQLKQQSAQRDQAIAQEKTVAKIVERIRKSLDLNTVFNTTTQEVRQLLKADRVVVYRFNPDWSGEVVAESFDTRWVSVIEIQKNDRRLYSAEMTTGDVCDLNQLRPGGVLTQDTYLQETKGGNYTRGKNVRVINDVYQAGFASCYVESLEKYQAKAYIIAPIFQEENLWGLLAVYQNESPRTWQESEVNLMLQVSTPLGVALQQAEFVAQLQYQQAEIEKTREQERTATRLVNRIRQSLDLNSIFTVTTQEIRQILKADRTAVYRFNPDWSGEVVAESSGSEWVSVMEIQKIDQTLYSAEMATGDVCDLNQLRPGTAFSVDTYLQETKGGRYTRGENVRIVNDVYQAGFSPCYLESLEKYQAKAYIITPIFQGKTLWGLLAVYQNDRPRIWQESEVNLMLQVSNPLGVALEQAEFVSQLREQTEQEQTVNKIIDRIRKSFDLNTIFRTTTQELRRMLKVDRMVVYRFNPDWSGRVISESFDPKWVSVMEIQEQDKILYSAEMTTDERCNLRELGSNPTLTQDTYLQDTKGGRYAQKAENVTVINNIYQADFASCYLESLEKYQAKAYIIVPIFQEEKLWGLLAAYQNSAPRNWDKVEVNLMLSIAPQLSIAVQQAEYVQKLQIQTKQLEKTANRERGLVEIADRMRRIGDLQRIFQIATQETRKLLEVDRLAIYRFNPDWSGEFIAESVVSGWIKLMDDVPVVKDTYIQDTQGGRYQKNESLVVNDIYTIGHQPCHIEILEQFQARAYMIAPIFEGQKLWGLIAAYQNSGPRQWEESELSALQQVGVQIGGVLLDMDYLAQARLQSENLAKAAERETNFIRLLAKINQKIIEQNQQQLKVESLFRTSTQELRKLLKVDRVAVLRFNPNWTGEFISEDVGSGYLKLVGTEQAFFQDQDIQETRGGRYRNNDNLVVKDINQGDLNTVEQEFLEELGAKACIFTPIFKGDQLWGLLTTYQNDRNRDWEDSEINLLRQASVQLGVAIQQSDYLEQVQAQSGQLAAAVEREKAAKEEIQQRAIELLTAVQPASSGDLTVRVPVTEDEVGTIAAAYNSTLDALREIVMQVQTAAAQVVQTTRGSTTAIEGLAHQSQKQFEELGSALDKIQEMLTATEATTQNAQQVGVAVEQANQTLQFGDTAMNKTVDSILAIRQTVSETSKRVKRLRDSSQKISKVVSLISDFAKQTNLLALNAALEATRAGEYGKGFAVVADEVRNLSHQSAEATTEIEKLVQEIQEETQEVATAMETGIQQVVEGTNLVNETRQSLNDIVAATAEISQLVEGITSATTAQKGQAELVTQVMTKVAAIANDTSADSLEISASFKELFALAQDLQASAGQFKVN